MKKFSLAYIPETMEIKLMNYLKKNINLDSREFEKLSIGLTLILFNVFEIFLVVLLAFLLGILKESLVFTLTFMIIRTFAAGVHCKTGHQCIITTLTFYLGSALLSKYYPINSQYAFIVGLAGSILLYKYAPADTENHPILGKEYRKKLKMKTMLSVALILVINLIINSTLLFNCAMYAIILESISVLPITYKIFNVNYNNYKLYE